MADLEAAYQAGRIPDEEFERQEEALLERLLEARRHHRRKQADAAGAGH